MIQPAGRAGVLLLDLFSALLPADVAVVISPMPRVRETTETVGGLRVRVTTWEPGWGDQHPGMLIVNGASPLGNDNPATRQLGRALARAGFLAVLPELPFLREGRFEATAAGQVEASFAALRASGATRGERASAFGSSVGGGVLLAAAGAAGPNTLRSAGTLVVLGAYFDLDTYLASVTAKGVLRSGQIAPWEPSAEVAERLPAAALAAMPLADREAFVAALGAGGGYEGALARLRALAPGARKVQDTLSPRAVWSTVAPPVFWLHDPDDAYEPLAEAEAARAAPRAGVFRLAVPALIRHAEVAAGDGGRGPLFIAGELLGLLGFAMEVMRAAS